MRLLHSLVVLMVVAAALLLALSGEIRGFVFGGPLWPNGALYGVLTMEAMLLAQILVVLASPGFRRFAREHSALNRAETAALGWRSVLQAVLAGRWEEVLFRGYVQGALGIIHPAVGIAAAGGLFGLAHLLNREGWRYAAVSGLIGLILGVARFWSGTLWAPIVAHMANNALAWVVIARPGG